MIPRRLELRHKDAVFPFHLVTLIGPRQGGKSTLCKHLLLGKVHVNLDAPDVRAFAMEDPWDFLAQCPEGEVVDEQRTSEGVVVFGGEDR